ncbi:MAG: hypothetical protein IKM34_01925 [Clostridia bacterium]|nr:hypothetical protein [Clostridia bacterium]
MKKRLDDLFDEASAKELDVVMENKDFSAPLDDDVLARIEKQTLEKSGLATPKAKKRFVKRALLLAATFALLLAVALGAVACAAEQKEYRKALAFFEEHNLSTEGLTRGEIKKVYRDITLRRFTYSKTAEVIEKSVWSQHLEGVEILQNDPTPEEIEDIWERLKENVGSGYAVISAEADNGIRYETLRDETSDFIECYEADQLRWSFELTLKSERCIALHSLADGLIAENQYDEILANGRKETKHRIVRINSQGDVLWDYVTDESKIERSVDCFDDDDGCVTVLFETWEVENGRGASYFNVKRFDAGGNLSVAYRNDLGGTIKKASRRDGGYLLLVSDGLASYIVTTDISGRIIDQFGYSDGDRNYEIRDVIEYDGKIYFTADVMPKKGAAYREYARKTFKDGGTDEKLLKLVRDHYTAALMVCDPSDGVPRECYTQKGAETGALSINEADVLVWDVKSIVTVSYARVEWGHEDSSMRIKEMFYGQCYMYQYAFDTDGKLLGQIQTERVEPFVK